MFDLYINNSTQFYLELAGKTGDDSRNEFLDNEAVFYQNGSWEYTSTSSAMASPSPMTT